MASLCVEKTLLDSRYTNMADPFRFGMSTPDLRGAMDMRREHAALPTLRTSASPPRWSTRSAAHEGGRCWCCSVRGCYRMWRIVREWRICNGTKCHPKDD